MWRSLHGSLLKALFLSTPHDPGPKFEVRLRKNTNGLGFSFVQVERGSCSLLRSDLIRIKRLFPGQPAEEHGAIAAGDIILAVNGRPTEGLVFQVRCQRLKPQVPGGLWALPYPPRALTSCPDLCPADGSWQNGPAFNHPSGRPAWA